MLATTTTTATTTTAMSLSLLQESNSLPIKTPTETQSIDSPDAAMPTFTPGQCLFCPKPSPTFADSVVHMQKSHGLLVPQQEHLAVELETFFKYLHLVIFGYRECIHCGTQRSTVQAVQQHMTGKGHCKFDISQEDSEFAEFYDFSEPEEDDAESNMKGDISERTDEQTATSSRRKLQLADEDTVRLPSGKIISRQSSAQTGPSLPQHRRSRTSPSPSRIEYTTTPAPNTNEGSGEGGVPQSQVLSRREKRERAMMTYQLANMSATDRSALMHLPSSQQRALLATQHRQAEKAQKDERRRQTRIDRKGNKNLYAYWATETPVYLCG